MKNLSKELLMNELNVKTAVLKEINEKIKEKKITNEAHGLYHWRSEVLGAIDMLQLLLNKQK